MSGDKGEKRSKSESKVDSQFSKISPNIEQKKDQSKGKTIISLDSPSSSTSLESKNKTQNSNITKYVIEKDNNLISTIPQNLFFIDTAPLIAVEKLNETSRMLIAKGNINNSISMYNINGLTKPMYTQEKNLVEKIQKFLSGKEDKEVEPEGEEEPQEDKNKGWDELDMPTRYFYQNVVEVCRRCKQVGHYEKWCPEESFQKCTLCCGPHSTYDCFSIVCFRCNDIGHMARDCKQNDPKVCYRCSKRGHRVSACGLITLNSKVYEKEKQDNMRNIKCYICLKYGHVTCDEGIIDGEIPFSDDLYWDMDKKISKLYDYDQEKAKQNQNQKRNTDTNVKLKKRKQKDRHDDRHDDKHDDRHDDRHDNRHDNKHSNRHGDDDRHNKRHNEKHDNKHDDSLDEEEYYFSKMKGIGEDLISDSSWGLNDIEKFKQEKRKNHDNKKNSNNSEKSSKRKSSKKSESSSKDLVQNNDYDDEPKKKKKNKNNTGK